MLHFNKELTTNQQIAMWQLKHEGGKRYDLFANLKSKHFDSYSEKFITQSNLYEDVVKAMHEHYKNLLNSDPSFITNWDTPIYYIIYDNITKSEDEYGLEHIRIDVKDLNKLAYMLQFFDGGKKTTKRTTKKAAVAEQQDEK